MSQDGEWSKTTHNFHTLFLLSHQMSDTPHRMQGVAGRQPSIWHVSYPPHPPSGREDQEESRGNCSYSFMSHALHCFEYVCSELSSPPLQGIYYNNVDIFYLAFLKTIASCRKGISNGLAGWQGQKLAIGNAAVNVQTCTCTTKIEAVCEYVT